MNREQFDAFVTEVDGRYRGRPRALRVRVALWAAIGYVGLLGSLIAVILLSLLCFRLAFELEFAGSLLVGGAGAGILVLGGWSAVQALWIRLEPPEGVEVTRADAPPLHALLDELRAQLRCAPFHRVLVVPDCNAAVVHHPRLGVFGWPRHHLLLGLPLLDGLSTAEFRAVLAHEFAHLSGEHARFGQWVYRLRRSWETVFARLQQPYVRGTAPLRPLLTRFIGWFWPRFNAHAFVLSRANEYEADAVAADLAGAPAIASALTRLCLLFGQVEERFWPEIWLRAAREPEAPRDILAPLPDLVRAPAPADVERWLALGFRRITTNADTHPCLSDRLRALGQLPPGGSPIRPLPLVEASAAESLLGPVQGRVRSALEAQWRKATAELWRERHLRAGAQGDRLQRLATAAPNSDTDADTLWEKAQAVMDLDGLAAVEPMLRRILELDHRHPAANFHLGRRLVQLGDDRAEGHLELVMALNDEGFAAASELLHQHFRHRGLTDKLRALESRLDHRERDLAASRQERNSVTAADTLIPHGLTDDELAPLRALLADEDEIVHAELGRKALRLFPEQRLFLLCVHVRRNWLNREPAERAQAAVNRLVPRVQLPGRVLIFSRTGGFTPLAHKLAAVSGADFYRRKAPG